MNKFILLCIIIIISTFILTFYLFEVYAQQLKQQQQQQQIDRFKLNILIMEGLEECSELFLQKLCMFSSVEYIR